MADAGSRRQLAAALLAAGLMLLAGCGGDDEEAASQPSSAPPAPETAPDGAVNVQLVEENDSGASGTATLTDGSDGASVAIEMRGGDGRYRAHIHDVSCERYRRMGDFGAQLATLTEGLTSVMGGRSKSHLIEPLSSYTRPGFSINVHEFAEPYPVVACGDLSAP
jgi:hypothetical protein